MHIYIYIYICARMGGGGKGRRLSGQAGQSVNVGVHTREGS